MMEVTAQVYVVVMVTLVGIEDNTVQATKLREEPLQSIQLLDKNCLFDDVGIPKYYLVWIKWTQCRPPQCSGPDDAGGDDEVAAAGGGGRAEAGPSAEADHGLGGGEDQGPEGAGHAGAAQHQAGAEP